MKTYNIFDHDRAVKPTLELVLQRIHPDHRDLAQQTFDRARAEGKGQILIFEASVVDAGRFGQVRPRISSRIGDFLGQP